MAAGGEFQAAEPLKLPKVFRVGFLGKRRQF